jgi:hypothetical protein
MDLMFGAPPSRASPAPPTSTQSFAVPPADFGLGPLSGGGGAPRRVPPKMGLDALGFGDAACGSSFAAAARPAGDAWAVDIVPRAPRAPLPVPKEAPTLDEVRATQAAADAAFAAAPYRSNSAYGVPPRSGGGGASVLKRRLPRAAPCAARRVAPRGAAAGAGADAGAAAGDQVLDEFEEVSECDDDFEEVDADVGPPLELPLPTWPPGTRGQPLQPGARPLSVPPNIAHRLMDFQKDGVRFLHRRWCLARGCILGDDMVRCTARDEKRRLAGASFARLRLWLSLSHAPCASRPAAACRAWARLCRPSRCLLRCSTSAASTTTRRARSPTGGGARGLRARRTPRCWWCPSPCCSTGSASWTRGPRSRA